MITHFKRKKEVFGFFIGEKCGLGVACGGSSSSSSNNDTGDAGSTDGTGSALIVTDKVTVVDVSESTSSNISALKFALPKTLPSNTNSQYYTDEQDVWMEEKSAESFDTVNEILCIMDQMGHDFMINGGWYIAQVDIALCDNNSDNAEAAAQNQQNQSSSGNVPEYEFYTAGFSRGDNSAPEYGNIWMHLGAGEWEPAMLIKVNLTIYESKDDAPPFGVFDMYFKAFIENEDGTPTDEVFLSGFLKSERQEGNSLILKFYVKSSGDEFGFTERVAMIREGENSFGVMAGEESFDGETHQRNYRISSNDAYFARDDDNEVVCEDRNNTVETVHSYGLYDPTTGARIERNSGFPISITPEDSNDSEDRIHGWAGYWEIHIDGDITINDGDTVYKQEWGPPEEQSDPIPYTVFKRGGKLVKHTRKTMTLGEINGISLSYYQCNDQGCTDNCTYWDSSAQKFYNYGTRNYDTYQCEELSSVKEVTFSTNEWSFHAWCESCGGSIEVKIRDQNENLVTLKNTDLVIFYLEETVTADATDVPTELACASECPDPSVINTDSPHFVKSMWETTDNFELVAEKVEPTKLIEDTHYVKYKVNNLILQHGGKDIVMDDSIESDFGVWSGALIKPSDVSKLKCDWTNENNTYGTCFWKARTEIDIYYTWETGPNSWNQYTGLQDADGDFVVFDSPLNLKYKHSDGATYQLQFEGHRNLHGIPGTCMSWETGKEVSCSDGGDIRWIPQFNILDGSTVTDESSGLTYLVKGLDKEQRMEIVDASLCEKAGLEFRLADGDLPDPDEFIDFDIGEEPVVTDPPAVIAGEDVR